MDHSYAKIIFEEIQARPYQLSAVSDGHCDNCYFKGIELIQKLGALGYAVRGRVAESYWDANIFPVEVLEKLPQDVSLTHFYPEVYIDGEWKIVDPSFQPELAEHGFPIGSWDGANISCFPITRVYSHEEAVAHQKGWHCTDGDGKLCDRGGSCWSTLNSYFEDLTGTQ